MAIHALALLAEARIPETGQHLQRLRHQVLMLARHLQGHPVFRDHLDGAMLDALFRAVPLHDLGLLAVPEAILRKPGPLSAEERAIMARHPTVGRQAVETAGARLGVPLERLGTVLAIVESHHERWDGAGYPRGLAREDIPVPARLLAVADVYDALTSRRPYKAPLAHEEAVRIMERGRGGPFDPDVLDAFLAISEAFRAVARRFPDYPSS